MQQRDVFSLLSPDTGDHPGGGQPSIEVLTIKL